MNSREELIEAMAVGMERRASRAGCLSQRALSLAISATALAAIEATGCVVVPREPTREMVGGWPDDPDTIPNRDDIIMAWNIMIAASPFALGAKP